MNAQETFRAVFDQAPIGMAYVCLEGKWVEVNKRLCDITGYTREELLAARFQEITHEDDLPSNLEALAKFKSGELDRYSAEKRYICKDERIIWVRISVSPVREAADQEPSHFIAALEDITEYKRAEELRRKAEVKCTAAFRQSPLSIVLLGLKDRRLIEANDAFEVFTGYSREGAIGRTTDDLNLFIDPADPKEMLERVAAGGRVNGWERRYRTKDGGIGSALFFGDLIEIDGEPCLIGAALDITERKRLESELEELSGRLIKAQDEERKWIAGELNDSLGQSITVINLEACQLARKREGEVGAELQALCSKIQDVAAGIGILSQSLYPSGLDYTGLPWAIEGLCRQFTHLYGMQVSFKHEGMPAYVSPHAALCLYRIAQEGLRNVVQHSGARQAWIELVSDGTNVRMEIRDRGLGFDVASTKAGLGLLTMRERCRRLGGWMAIHREDGTRLEVEIPLVDGEPDLFHSAEAAGPAEDA